MTNVTKLFPDDAAAATERPTIARVPPKKGLRTVEIAVPGSQVERVLRITEALARGESWRSALETAGLSTDMLDSIGVVASDRAPQDANLMAPVVPAQPLPSQTPPLPEPEPAAAPVQTPEPGPVPAAVPAADGEPAAAGPASDIAPVAAIPAEVKQADFGAHGAGPVAVSRLEGFIDYPPLAVVPPGFTSAPSLAETMNSGATVAVRPTAIELRPTRDDRIPGSIEEEPATTVAAPEEEIELTWQAYALIATLGVAAFALTLFMLGRL